jgi:ribosomal protein L13
MDQDLGHVREASASSRKRSRAWLRNRLGRAMVKKLKVYAGPQHPHQAQQPEPWAIEA